MMRNFFTLQNYNALGEKAMLILVAILKLLVYKVPEDPQPKYHFWVGIEGSSQVVLLEAKTITGSGRIEVFKPQERGESPDPKMHECSNIRTIGNLSLILVEKLTDQG
jgi:hypothetical protein